MCSSGLASRMRSADLRLGGPVHRRCIIAHGQRLAISPGDHVMSETSLSVQRMGNRLLEDQHRAFTEVHETGAAIRVKDSLLEVVPIV